MRALDAADGCGTARLAGAFVLTWGGLRFLSVIAPQGIGVVEVTVPSLLGAADPQKGGTCCYLQVFLKIRLDWAVTLCYIPP